MQQKYITVYAHQLTSFELNDRWLLFLDVCVKIKVIFSYNKKHDFVDLGEPLYFLILFYQTLHHVGRS
jgi:hypothetical protein